MNKYLEKIANKKVWTEKRVRNAYGNLNSAKQIHDKLKSNKEKKTK